MTIDDIKALPPQDAEQDHLLAEMSDPTFVEAVHHDFAVRCGNCGSTQPVTISFRPLPEDGAR